MLFGYKLDAGTGSTKSILENQGYTVNVRRDITYTRLSSIEIFGFKNEYLNNMQLWIEAFNHRVFLYKWSGAILADQSGAASIERLLQYISGLFGESEIPADMKSMDNEIDASLLKAIANYEASDHPHFVWKSNEKQVEMFLLPRLLPTSPLKIDFTLNYFLPDEQKKVSTYQNGD